MHTFLKLLRKNLSDMMLIAAIKTSVRY